MDEILESFIVESVELIDEAEKLLLSLEKDFEKSTVDSLFRMIHTIKGNSGLFELEKITELSHHLEQVLQKVRNDELKLKPASIDHLLVCMDNLRTLINNIENIHHNIDIKDLIEGLINIVNGTYDISSVTRAIVPSKSTVNQNVASQEPEVSSKNSLLPLQRAVSVESLSKAIPEEVKNEIKKNSDRAISDGKINILNHFKEEFSKLIYLLEDEIVSIEIEFNGDNISDTIKKIQPILTSCTQFKNDHSAVLLASIKAYLTLVVQKKLIVTRAYNDVILIALDRLRKVHEGSASININSIIKDINKIEGIQILAQRIMSELQNHSPQVIFRKKLKFRGNGGLADESQVKKTVFKFQIPNKYITEAQVNNVNLYAIRILCVDKEIFINVIESYVYQIIKEVVVKQYILLLITLEENITQKLTKMKLAEFVYSQPVRKSTKKRLERTDNQSHSKPLNVAKTKIAKVDEVKKVVAPLAVNTPPERINTHLKVPITLIDTLINLASESVIARNELTQIIDDFKFPTLLSSVTKVSQLITTLQEKIMRTRMQPLDIIFHKVPRLVRDLEKNTGKSVDVHMEGGDINLDKTIIDIIGDPVMHMIRNSMDHGFESAETRLTQGKKRQGLLNLSAHLRSNNIIIVIQDDGNGINTEVVKAKAVEKNMITQAMADTMEEEQAMNLIFHPGFSTATEITMISGRGVGMDVVRTNINKGGGEVTITSEVGKGTTITVILPQTLSIITCLIIKSYHFRFAIPQRNIEKLLSIDSRNISLVEDKLMYNLGDQIIPVLNLNNVLNLQSEEELLDKHLYIAIVKSEYTKFGIFIEKQFLTQEIVIKPLGTYFSGVPNLLGAAIMGDGEAILILDIPSIARENEIAATVNTLETQVEVKNSDEYLLANYLLFEVDQQRFTITTDGISKIIMITPENKKKFAGFDGIHYLNQTVPLIRLSSYLEFIDKKKTDTELAVIYNVDGSYFGIIANKVLHVMNHLGAIREGGFSEDIITGSAIVDDRSVMLLHIEKLLKQFRDHFKVATKFTMMN